MKQNRLTGILVGLFCLVFFGLSVGSALRESLTYDEIVHMQEGRNALVRHQFLIDTYNPPLVRELATLPLELGAGTLIHSSTPNIQAIPARLMIIILGLLLSFGVFLVARHYFGISIGLLAFILFIFEPNILANSHYVTLDIGGALFFFLAYMTFIRALTKPTGKNWIIFGVTAGCMAASKITSLPFFAVSAILVSIFMFGKSTIAWFWNKKALVVIALFITLLTLWAIYFFKWDVVVIPTVWKGRLSDRLPQTAVLRFLKTQPIPLGNYIAVLKNTVLYAGRSKQVFFWGRFYNNAKWYYIIVNTLVKSSIPLLILFVIGVWFGLRDKIIRRSVIILFIPVVAVLVLASTGHMLPWVRYLLPMIPFFVILAASSIRYIKRIWAILLVLLLLMLHIIGTLSFYPHFISYTNELMNRKTSYLKLMDSNMDWGQSLLTFAEYVNRVKPSSVNFSYFGRDDGAGYGLPSNVVFGGYKEEDICAFHPITFPQNKGHSFTAISVSNWYYCGYFRDPKYFKNKIKYVVANSIFIY
jgi:4-amino-4-deoxy-L-arabinose transferase-like glycosyltransferase